MVLSKFMPSNHKFSEKFTLAARNAHATAQALVDLLDNYTDVEGKVRRIRDLEHTTASRRKSRTSSRNRSSCRSTARTSSP